MRSSSILTTQRHQQASRSPARIWRTSEDEFVKAISGLVRCDLPSPLPSPLPSGNSSSSDLDDVCSSTLGCAFPRR